VFSVTVFTVLLGNIFQTLDNSLFRGTHPCMLVAILHQSPTLLSPPSQGWFACPIGPHDIASGWIAQKTRFLAAASVEDHTENTTSISSSIVACKHGHGLMMSTEPLPSNRYVYKAVPKQRPSLLASQFQLSADV
jgi:hypothetical protein